MVQERRHAKRYPAAPERKETGLKVGDDTFRARIMDESATGFALQVEGHPAVYEGEHVWLRYEGAWTACHVMSIVPISGGCRLGLSRQAEVNNQQFSQLEKLQAKRRPAHRVRTRNTMRLDSWPRKTRSALRRGRRSMSYPPKGAPPTRAWSTSCARWAWRRSPRPTCSESSS
jgi:hypothetical protein